MSEFLPYLSIGFAAVLLVLVAMRDAQHKGEVERLQKVNADLLDRLMSRDFGEYRVARNEEREEAHPTPNPYAANEDEDVLNFQTLGDDFDLEDLSRGGM